MSNEWIPVLLEIVFADEEERYHEKEVALVADNCLLGNHGSGFYYGALLISAEEGRLRQWARPATLAPELYPRAADLARERTYLDRDRKRAAMGFAVLLSGMEESQNVRDALPEYLVKALIKRGHPLEDLPRSRPEAWPLAGDPRKEREYEKLRDLLSIYRMAELVS
jgi:hypothetical protein